MMDESRGSVAQAKFGLDVQELSPLLITPGHLQVYGNSSEGPILLSNCLLSVQFFFPIIKGTLWTGYGIRQMDQ